MNRAKWLILLMLVACGGAWAQSGVSGSSVQVGTLPIGAAFSVDGVSYLSTQVFTLACGQQAHHTDFPFTTGPDGKDLPFQLSSDGLYEFAFGGWSAGGATLGGGAASVTFTATPGIPSVIASLSESFQTTVSFPNSTPGATCSGAPNSPTMPGFVDGVVYLLQLGAVLPPPRRFIFLPDRFR